MRPHGSEVTDATRAVAEPLDQTSSDAADRIRERAGTLGAGEPVPIPLDRGTVMAAHRALGLAVQDTMIDCDEPRRDRTAAADAGLGLIPEHLGPRIMGDVHPSVVGDPVGGRG